jgi:hypothetical protein
MKAGKHLRIIMYNRFCGSCLVFKLCILLSTEKAGITLSYKDWLFSVESLLPWYPFVPCHGVSTACFETINELQEKCLLKKAVPGWQTVKDFLKVLSAYSQKERDVTEVVVPVERLVNYPTPSLFTAGSKQSV